MRFLLLTFLLISSLTGAISEKDAEAIGMQIWKNEGGCKVENLTAWNEGESFASMGIGHFIWYPEGQKGPFRETFPSFLTFLKEEKISFPKWLENSKGCPWRSREEFKREFQSKKVVELRRLLQGSLSAQTKFIIKRMQNALPEMVKGLTEERKRLIEHQFNRLFSEPAGTFVLIDYVNFKGEGTSPEERYQGEGWGLLQVLELMRGSGDRPIEEFMQCAKTVLARRVANAPPERNEQRWLKGWFNRIDGYIHKPQER